MSMAAFRVVLGEGEGPYGYQGAVRHRRYRDPMMPACSFRAHLWSGASAVALPLLLAAGSVAATSYHVSQRDRAFSLKAIAIAVGGVIHFDNNDDFIHQIYIDSPDFKFDSRESYPGNSIDVTFPKRGTYVVQCHIHPKMSLEVTVE
jgi:plastocyanin